MTVILRTVKFESNKEGEGAKTYYVMRYAYTSHHGREKIPSLCLHYLLLFPWYEQRPLSSSMQSVPLQVWFCEKQESASAHAAPCEHLVIWFGSCQTGYRLLTPSPSRHSPTRALDSPVASSASSLPLPLRPAPKVKYRKENEKSERETEIVRGRATAYHSIVTFYHCGGKWWREGEEDQVNF